MNMPLNLPADATYLDKETKVVALRLGYSDFIREPGEIFYVPKGTVMRKNCWFTPVEDNTATTDELRALEAMTIPDLKIALAREGVDFAGVNKKSDLIALLADAQAQKDLV